MDIKIAANTELLLSAQKEQGIIEVKRNLMHFLLTLKSNQITTLQIKYLATVTSKRKNLTFLGTQKFEIVSLMMGEN